MNAATVTKSIRISAAESQELTRLSTQLAASETALLRQWIREGLRAQKIELALRRYMRREIDLRTGAALAVTIEMERRKAGRKRMGDA